jgi:competence protein ComEC
MAAAASTGRYRPAPPADTFLPESIWRAPLVPAALAVTAGILLDRRLNIPLPFALTALVAALLAWLAASIDPRRLPPVIFLALGGVGFGAAYHHFRRDFAVDDLGRLATSQPQPVRVRGLIEEEPFHAPPPVHDDLHSRDPGEHTTAVLQVTALHSEGQWVLIGGRVRLIVEGAWQGAHVGDKVEVVGRLMLASGPGNPGEFDYADSLRDQGIGSILVVRGGPKGLTRLEAGWQWSPRGWLVMVRNWGQEVLTREMPKRTSGVAVALLLGEGAPMTREDWDKYLLTGVIHVLAISGQHLVILAAALWFLLPRLNVRQRQGAIFVAGFLLGYALLTGGRPPAMRSAVVVCAACTALVLRRRTLPANLFALAWLVVLLINPTDAFSAGCLLSFLSVAVLCWGTRWLAADGQTKDPLDRLLADAQPPWLRGIRWIGQGILKAYLLTLVIWLAVTPLAASRFHVVAPVGILLGPPLVLLTTIALLSGFLLLATGALCPPLTVVVAPVVHSSLLLCDVLAEAGLRLPGGHTYVGDIAEWWLWVFYLGLLAVLMLPPLRRRWRQALSAGAAWLCVGLIAGAAGRPSDELRCTFLAVGHGGCTVMRTPDGRTLLYDAGALAGPEVTRRVIAPYLWSQGIARIDEVLISHADLDHFNGLVPLLNLFSVGHVTHTPTFSDKKMAAVGLTLAALADRGVPVRTVKAGDVLHAGDVRLEVLHPPADGPAGVENVRSMVLAVQHAEHEFLLTGDLEGEGQARLLQLARRRIDVLMAPHHGSVAANGPALARWARAPVIVACQGPPQGPQDGGDAYRRLGQRYLSTWEHGAVTIRSHTTGVIVETFRTRERFVVPAQ